MPSREFTRGIHDHRTAKGTDPSRQKKAEAITLLGFLAWLIGHAEFWQVMKLTLGDYQ